MYGEKENTFYIADSNDVYVLILRAAQRQKRLIIAGRGCYCIEIFPVD